MFHRSPGGNFVDVGLPAGLADVDLSWNRGGMGRTWSLVFSNLLIRSLKETWRGRGFDTGFLEVALVPSNPRYEVSDTERFCDPQFVQDESRVS